MTWKTTWASFASACAAISSPVLAQDTIYLSTDLFGQNVPGGGVEDATGDFNGEIDFTKSQICYYLEVEDLPDAVTGAIHEGGADNTGPAIVPLTLPTDEPEETCVEVDGGLLQAITRQPANYYVAIIDGAHPDGAIRGQLGK
jgi:hypothetical protein